jgi:FkbH-like protein
VLIAIASKNDAPVVEAALDRADLILSREVPFPIEVHWNPKSESVRRILQTWNIDSSSVVFVDDNLMELDEVKLSHPGLECVHFPSHDYQTAYGMLARLRDLFGKQNISEEDLLRAHSIRQNAIAREPTRASGNEFLKHSAASVCYSFKVPEPRAFELINKTNQFNLNGRRYTESEWAAYLSDRKVKQIVVSYQDKYGPLGKIAVLTGRPHGKQFYLDNWVMSCRAFSRCIEHHSLAYVFEHFGSDEILLDFKATAKNGPIQSFLGNLPCEKHEGKCRISRTMFESYRPLLVHRVDSINE